MECWRWKPRSMLSGALDSKEHGSGLTAETTRVEAICPTMRLRWKRTGWSLRRWWKPRGCIQGWSWITTKSGLCSMRLQRRLCGRTEFTAHKNLYIYICVSIVRIYIHVNIKIYIYICSEKSPFKFVVTHKCWLISGSLQLKCHHVWVWDVYIYIYI